MKRTEVAEALVELARYLEMKGENRFKVGAYERAADAIEAAEDDPETLVREGRLTSIDGIGKGTAAVIEELVRHGRSGYLEEMRAEFPASLLELAELPGVGAKKATQLHAELGIETVDDLVAAIEKGTVGSVSGFGPKTIERVRQGIETWRESRSKVLLPMALEIAGSLVDRIGLLRSVDSVEVAGEVRRRAETVSELVLVVAAKDPRGATEEIVSADLPGHFRAVSGGIEGTVRPSLSTRIHVVTPREKAASLFFHTGSADLIEALNAGGPATIDREGVRIGRRLRRPKSEEEVLELFGQPYLDPELRESRRVLELGKQARRIVERAQIRGTFHVHSTWSDGKDTLDAMVAAAEELGFEYLGISDHSKTASYAGGLDENRVAEQHADLRRIQKSTSMKLFRGTECDILPDGGMDFDDVTLASFDFVIGSVHSRFTMSADEMSERIIRALGNPWVTFLGHLTGRKLLIREGYSVEFERVFDAAAEHGVMIEINGNPRRQDLDWRLMRDALDRGVRFSIHPDAHSTAALEHVTTGVWNARRGLVPTEAIFNTRPVEEVAEHFESRRKRALAAAR